MAAVIGDTVADAEAAKANRLPFILAAYGYGRGFPGELEEASFTAGNAGEVEAQLNRIELFSSFPAVYGGSGWLVSAVWIPPVKPGSRRLIQNS